MKTTTSATPNQNPEQRARDVIDSQLEAAGWAVQSKNQIDLSASRGIAVREYDTDTGPMDYLLIVDDEPCGVIEAKKETEGQHLSSVAEQSRDYSVASLKTYGHKDIRFIYESTGTVMKFRDMHDPKPRQRDLFAFQKPETLAEIMAKGNTLRKGLQQFPPLDPTGLRACQVNAITNLEKSLGEARPRALIQMATGSGKTFTAITSIYRMLKYAGVRRVLMLVDTRNLGEQAESEFINYQPTGEQHKFTELYPVQRLQSHVINDSSRVCICTIQRMYSILKGEDLDDETEDAQGGDWHPKTPAEVEYNAAVPPEMFDVVIIDECHRSIYNLWQQVLDYFDAFLVGLTATPDARTYAFFQQNVVSEYTHEQAVVDGVNVPAEVYSIETNITRNGAKLEQQLVQKRDKLTRQKRWEQMDEETTYTGKDLDRSVVNESQIRTVLTEFKKQLPITLFPGRREVPKTLIFAKDDSHADDIIRIVGEVFAEDSQFCKKITYHSKEDPKSVLAQFRNEYNPRIAVTVDMIATGTDVRPLECLLFMRDVRSKNYFEQMKGRGTRTYGEEDLKKVTPSATGRKTHFVIVDAVGVCKSVKTSIRPFEGKPSVPLKDLLQGATLKQLDEESASSLAGRLIRLNNELSESEKTRVEVLTKGVPLNQIAGGLLQAIDPDKVNEKTEEIKASHPELAPADAENKARKELMKTACAPFNGALANCILDIRREHDQILDNENIDSVVLSKWNQDVAIDANKTLDTFKAFLEKHRADIVALQIYYDQPYRRRELTLSIVKDLVQRLENDESHLTVGKVWNACYQLGKTKNATIDSKESALIALVRYVLAIDKKLVPLADTVKQNFQKWTMTYNSHHTGAMLTPDQMEILHMVRDHIATSFHIAPDDFEFTPFNERGGYHRFRELFGAEAQSILDELNEVLAA